MIHCVLSLVCWHCIATGSWSCQTTPRTDGKTEGLLFASWHSAELLSLILLATREYMTYFSIQLMKW